jgi:hypothetical protein
VSGLAIATAVAADDRRNGLREVAGAGPEGESCSVALLGDGSGEVLSAVQMATLRGLRYPQVRDAVITHPTMGEGLNLLFDTARRPRARRHRPAMEMSSPPGRFRSMVSRVTTAITAPISSTLARRQHRPQLARADLRVPAAHSVSVPTAHRAELPR